MQRRRAGGDLLGAFLKTSRVEGAVGRMNSVPATMSSSGHDAVLPDSQHEQERPHRQPVIIGLVIANLAAGVALGACVRLFGYDSDSVVGILFVGLAFSQVGLIGIRWATTGVVTSFNSPRQHPAVRTSSPWCESPLITSSRSRTITSRKSGATI